MSDRKSARNAVTHGIFTSIIVLRNENNALFLHLEREYLEQWKPVGPLEANLVDQLITADWRLRRIWQTETARIDLQMDRDALELQKELGTFDEPIRTSVALEHVGDQSRFLDHVHRYEVRFTRQLERTSRYLRALQDLRRSKSQRNQSNLNDLQNEKPAA